MKSIRNSIELLMQINVEMMESVNEYIDNCIHEHLDISLDRVNNILKYFRNLKTDIANQFLSPN
ncbi:MAG: hypothetical protein ACJ75J_07915 [Cytophagaceae bacterium]